ncbi:MAG: DUF4931 domain-containing protein [Candidatus Roizmanbacteria bacterium]|nr:MAG: DUF4931 domain-containing protein [Candidatus Roizmanbacteria bacterium]
MSKYVPDISSRRWALIASDRLHRPSESDDSKLNCPFCPGNEKVTGPEVFRMGEGEKDKPGWKVRVIPNKFPITDFHEVIIHSPDHEKDIDSFSLSEITLIFQTYKARFNFYKEKGEVMIFCNHGEHAGASVKHSHSQLVVIPFQINLDLVSSEPLHNVINENKYFHVYCPEFSQWPYEVWLAPKKKEGVFGDIDDKEIEDIAELLKKIIKRLKKIHKEDSKWNIIPFGYNFYIYPKENWYLRVIPRFIHRAGFELGTGLSVNVIDPIDAASALRGEDERVADVMKKLKRY